MVDLDAIRRHLCLSVLLQLRPRDRARAMSALRAVLDLTMEGDEG